MNPVNLPAGSGKKVIWTLHSPVPKLLMFEFFPILSPFFETSFSLPAIASYP